MLQASHFKPSTLRNFLWLSGSLSRMFAPSRPSAVGNAPCSKLLQFHGSSLRDVQRADFVQRVARDALPFAVTETHAPNESAPAPSDPIAPVRAAIRSHYEILRQIGQGAFATVYLCLLYTSPSPRD